MGSLSISTLLIGTSEHSCREFIPTFLPYCFSAKLKTGILKDRDIEIFTLGSRKPETCPTRLRKTCHQAYLPVSSITFSVPPQRRHTPLLLQGPEASSSASAERTEALSWNSMAFWNLEIKSKQMHKNLYLSMKFSLEYYFLSMYWEKYIYRLWESTVNMSSLFHSVWPPSLGQ